MIHYSTPWNDGTGHPRMIPDAWYDPGGTARNQVIPHSLFAHKARGRPDPKEAVRGVAF